MPNFEESLGQRIFQTNLTTNYKETIPTYRFYIFPLNPSAKTVIQNGKLAFRANYEQHGYNYDLYTVNYYNIKALVANDFESLQKQMHARGFYPNKHILVVDIPRTLLDEGVKVKRVAYQGGEPTELGSMIKHIQETWDGIQYQLNDKALPYPYFAQSNALVYTSGLCRIEQYFTKTASENSVQRKSQVKIYDYSEQNSNLGQDIFIPVSLYVKTTHHIREYKLKYDWVSHVNDNINKKAYLNLTQGCYEVAGNAEKIAALYDDYATKGQGFSAFIHFHWFRHTANIIKAKEIAKTLREKFQDADNASIADFLVEKFTELKAKNPINEKGSFARRTNYAILQLTNGLCDNVEDYQKNQQQKLQYKQLAR